MNNIALLFGVSEANDAKPETRNPVPANSKTPSPTKSKTLQQKSV